MYLVSIKSEERSKAFPEKHSPPPAKFAEEQNNLEEILLRARAVVCLKLLKKEKVAFG